MSYIFRSGNSEVKKYLLLMLILVVYALFVVWKFGVVDGLSVTLLTWAFFVTCTPIADAGFLLDFPIRLVTGIKMFWTEVVVWSVAGVIIAYHFFFSPAIFETMGILKLFHVILTNPWPLWGVIVISAVGTFLSITIGDEVYDFLRVPSRFVHQRSQAKTKLLTQVAMLGVVLIVYLTLLHYADISIELF